MCTNFYLFRLQIIKLFFSVYTLGHVGRFQKKLEKRIRNQEREIERMCGFHYSHFVEAIEELSGIQGDASKLVRQVSETNTDLQQLGGDISTRHMELIRIRRQQDNINKVSTPRPRLFLDFQNFYYV